MATSTQQFMDTGDNGELKREDVGLKTQNMTIRWHDFNTDLETLILNKREKGCRFENTEYEHKKELDENKVEYKYIDITYLVDLGMHCADGIYGDIRPETVADISLHSFGLGAIVNGVGVAAYGIHSAYTYFNKWQEDNQLTLKKYYNSNVARFNEKLNGLKILETEILRKKNELIEYEKKLNNEFQVERMHPTSKVVICIGPTGYGKSLVCNRLIGNTKKVEELQESDKEPFNVAEYLDPDSVTKMFSKKTKKVSINAGNGPTTSFVLSVVDTPGAFDSDGADVKYQNIMGEYFTASAGVNMFCVFFKVGQKIDSNYKKLLAVYGKFWGIDFWKHCVIIITYCDQENIFYYNRMKAKLPNIKKRITEFLKSLDILCEPPIYEFGKLNFKSSLEKMFSTIIDGHNVCNKKYKCDKIVTPFDKLWNETEKLCKEHRSLAKELNALSLKVK
eukprot:503986_1